MVRSTSSPLTDLTKVPQLLGILIVRPPKSSEWVTVLRTTLVTPDRVGCQTGREGYSVVGTGGETKPTLRPFTEKGLREISSPGESYPTPGSETLDVNEEQTSGTLGHFSPY